MLLLHTAQTCAPGVAAKVPATHGVQAVLPEEEDCVPVGQSTHTPAEEVVPGGQGLQAVLLEAPALALYLPAAHAFCVALVEPTLHQCPAEQARQSALLVAPALALYVPSVHAFCVALVDSLPHQCPAAHRPEQAEDVPPPRP